MKDLLRKVRRMLFGAPGAKEISKVIAQFEKGIATLNLAADNCNTEVNANIETIGVIEKRARTQVAELEEDNALLATNVTRARKIAENFNKLCDM